MIHFIKDCVQGEPEWFAHRLGSVGGSSASAMLAVGQGKTRTSLMYKLAAEIATGQSTYLKPSEYMLEGTRREEQSREYLSFIEDIKIDQCALIKNDDIPGAHYSPDGFNVNEMFIVELKNPAGHTQIELLKTGTIGKAYIDQMQFGLMITGFDYCLFLSYVPGIKPFIARIERDERYIQDIRTKLSIFVVDLEKLISTIKD